MSVDEVRILQWVRMLSFEVLSHNNDNSQSICLFVQKMNMQPDLVSMESEPPFAGNDAEPQLPLSNQQQS